MKVDVYTIEKVLADPRCYLIPIYQRNYAWTIEFIESFWEDTTSKAEVIQQEIVDFSHYLGALIIELIADNPPIAKTPRVHIVDGQQRLTSILLLLIAIREVAIKYDLTEVQNSVENYLTNKPKSKDKDISTVRFKLVPTISDRKMFHYFIDNRFEAIKEKYSEMFSTKKSFQNSPKLLQAYDFFYWEVLEFVKNPPFNDQLDSENSETHSESKINLIEDRLNLLLDLLLNHVKVVLITLEQNDDPQIIFECLNAKSEPLIAMDLVRNYIFFRANKEDISIEDLHKNYWLPFTEPWWGEKSGIARSNRPMIDHFLSHVLIAETGKNISIRNLYSEYKKFTSSDENPRFQSVVDELKLLKQYAPYFETLEQRICIDESLARIGKKFANWKVTTTYPIILQIMNSDLEQEERNILLDLLYSYVVRRIVSGLTTRSFSNVFQSLANYFLEVSPSERSFKEFFANRPGNGTRFPDDVEFKAGILNNSVYSNTFRSAINDLLCELELKSRHDQAEDVKLENLQIEHVLPQNWTRDWQFPKGEWVDNQSGTESAINRIKIINTLGNLTLIKGGLNSAAGNLSFVEKKKLYHERGTLFLNRCFNNKDKWDETDIRERGKKLAEMAIKIWRGPTIE